MGKHGAACGSMGQHKGNTLKGSGSVGKHWIAWDSIRKHFKGLRQYGAACGSIRKHFKGLRQYKAAWGSMGQYEETL